MDALKYLESLTEKDLGALATVLRDDVMVRIRLGETSVSEEDCVGIVDGLIKRAPALEEDVTLYKAYQGGGDFGEGVKGGGTFTEGGFLGGLVTRPRASGSIVFTLKIPKGTRALYLSGEEGDAYVLGRGMKLSVSPGENATLVSGATVIYSQLGWAPQEEFHEGGGHDQSTHGGKGGGGKLKASSPKKDPFEKRLARRDKINDVMQVLGVVTSVVGLALTGFLIAEKIQNREQNKKGGGKPAPQNIVINMPGGSG